MDFQMLTELNAWHSIEDWVVYPLVLWKVCVPVLCNIAEPRFEEWQGLILKGYGEEHLGNQDAMKTLSLFECMIPYSSSKTHSPSQ